MEKGAFDAVTVYDGVNRTLVHNCQMNADMVHMFVKHESFPCDAAFTEVCCALSRCPWQDRT